MDLPMIAVAMLLLGIVSWTAGEVKKCKWLSILGGYLVIVVILGMILFFFWSIFGKDTAY